MDARSSLSAHACFASVKVRALSLTRSTPTQDTYIFVYRCHKAFEGSDQQQLNPHSAVKWYALTVTGCLGLSVLDQVVNKFMTRAHADQSFSLGAVVCGASKTRDGLPSISSSPPLRTPSEGSASRGYVEVLLKCEIPRKKESARSTPPCPSSSEQRNRAQLKARTAGSSCSSASHVHELLSGPPVSADAALSRRIHSVHEVDEKQSPIGSRGSGVRR